MQRITNISITERAAIALDVQIVTFRPRRPGEVFALVYMFRFVNADGTTVEGFRPGYMATSWEFDEFSPGSALAHLPSGMEFYFQPRFVWSAHGRYVVDMASDRYVLFSIGPET